MEAVFKLWKFDKMNYDAPPKEGGVLIYTAPSRQAIRTAVGNDGDIYWWDTGHHAWSPLDRLGEPVSSGTVFQQVVSPDGLQYLVSSEDDIYKLMAEGAHRRIRKLSEELTNWAPVHRQKFFSSFAEHFGNIYHNLTRGRDAESGLYSKDKEDFPIAMTQGGPGSGKSFALDCISSKVDALLEALSNRQHSLADIFRKRVVPVPVTYNKFQGAIDVNRDPAVRLGLRMLHSYFRSNMSFDSFLGWCILKQIDIAQLTSRFCAKLISRHSESHVEDPIVLLLVDELLLVGDSQAVSNTLLAIGLMLDREDIAADVVVSSLDPTAFAEFKTESKRGWDWLPLNPVHEGVDKLFDPKINPVFATKAVKTAVVECSGHPRTLQTLYFEALKYSAQHPPGFLDLIAKLVMKCNVLITLDMLRPVILQRAVPVNGKLPSSTTTYKDLAARSIYLNSLSPGAHSFLPLMSTVLMRKFAEVHRHFKSDPLDDAVAHVLGKLFAAADHISPVAFEQFHAHFELLRRLLTLENDVDTSLNSQYPLAEFFGFDPFTVNFYTTGTRSCLLPNPFAASREQGVLSDTETIFTYPHSNPGFDATVMQKKSKGHQGKILLCWETRLSSGNATTVQGAAEVIEKHALTINAVKEALGDSSEPAPDVYLIILAYRRVPNYHAATVANIPAGIIVMDREALMNLYGPFQFRASFVADTLEELEQLRQLPKRSLQMAGGSSESDSERQRKNLRTEVREAESGQSQSPN
eukprot:GILJ01002583.1.p1 GENE.GILJ01002583.1~~GILJ01002583.1.p1  ORF type:complete len:749 (-),score=74.63 GILJ01002583.1:125-2371(-)